MRNTAVSDPALPCHFERSKIRQMPEDFQSPIRELATRVLAQVQVLQLWHARQVPQSVVGELPRAAEREGSDVVELGDAREHRIRHQPIRFQSGDAALFHDGYQLVPLFVAQLPAWRDPVFRRIDCVGRDRRSAGGRSSRESRPTSKPGILRDDGLRFSRPEIVA